MSRWYRFLYRVGFTPWEQDSATAAPQFSALVAQEEATREPPYGSALDLGCGTGRWSVELARRGWQVVGVDVIPKAVEAARRRAQTAGVDVAFFEGDVTALRSAGVGSGFSFLLDVECFNHLNDSQREAMGREVDAVAAADATLLLLVWARARRGPLPPGASREDLQTAFPGWQVVDEQPYDGELPRPLRSVAPRWYRLARA
ncbi:MAG: class I SAM-dependent methyltransferase [Acidimicrobiia bacterium]